MSQSPALPWEVIERVIDHSAKNIRTLYSFTLTCRDLRPRSTILLLDRVRLRNRDQIFSLCGVLEAKPHLKPCVRSVSIYAKEFSPHPLLRILPNLSEIEFTDDYFRDQLVSTSFHPSVLKYCRHLGQNIRTLSLQGLVFSSLSTFSDILLLFPRINILSCENLSLRLKDGGANREPTTRRLSERLRLTSLTINSDVDNMLFASLREVTKNSIETLTITDVSNLKEEPRFAKFLLASQSDWIQLTSLSFKLNADLRFLRTIVYDFETGTFKSIIRHVITIFENFHPAKLQEVIVNIIFRDSYPWWKILFEEFPPALELCAELEKTLLAFAQPTLSFSPPQEMNNRSYHSWMPTLQNFFPALAECGALKINAQFSGQAGHDGGITPIVISADSRLAATGSLDGTIIIWDLKTGCISQEWFTGDTAVRSIAFSPDSQYIVSTSGRAGTTVWDVHQGGRKVNTLMIEEHNRGYMEVKCAWSPNGSWIAVHRYRGAIHVWETTTFRSLQGCQGTPAWNLKDTNLVAISPDGRRVVTATCNICYLDYCIWDMELGKLHRSLEIRIRWGGIGEVFPAAFDPDGLRIVIGSSQPTIWDVETGRLLLVLKPSKSGCWGTEIAFSGNGKMVLSYAFTEGVRVWDASNGVLLKTLPRTTGWPTVLSYASCFSPCGGYIAAVSDNRTACLWKTSNWSCIAEVFDVQGKFSSGRRDISRVAFSPDGKVLICGTEKGTVFFRRMHDLISASQD